MRRLRQRQFRCAPTADARYPARVRSAGGIRARLAFAAPPAAGRTSRRRPAPAHREEEFYRQRDRRRLSEDRVRRRISSRRPCRPHPQIRGAGAGVRRRHPRRPQGADRQDRRRHRGQGPASRHRHGRRATKTPMCWSSWCATATSIAPSRPSMAASAPRRSSPRSTRNACRASARTRNSRSSAPTSSSPSTMATSFSSTAPMKSCCNRWGRSTTPTSVPWTMFNDNVSMGYFDVYDQYLLNLLYDPRIKAGMTVHGSQGRAARGARRCAGVGEEGERAGGVSRHVLSVVMAGLDPRLSGLNFLD